MIILITNRAITKALGNSPENVSPGVLGKDIGDGSLHVGEVVRISGHDKVRLYPQGQEKDLFDSITQDDVDRPWVFFVHGNNQNTRKNIGKCRDLEAQHGVNVVAFSWPSQPYMEQDQLTSFIKDLGIKGIRKLVGLPASFSSLPLDIGMLIHDYHANYKQAQRNAVDSAPHLEDAMTMVKRWLFSRMGSGGSRVLLVHSLGHEAMREMTESHDVPISFSNIILHQADTDWSRHTDWIPLLKRGRTKIYITSNQYDSILMASRMANTDERLGQTTRFPLGKAYCYINFTDGGWVDESHNFFIHEKEDMNEAVYDLMNRLLQAKPDGLPTRPMTANNSGFALVSRDRSVYRLEYILDPTGDGDANDDDQYMRTV